MIPLLVVHGSDDVLTMPEGSKALVAGASSRDKQLLLLEGKKHHVILDIGGDQVCKDGLGIIKYDSILFRLSTALYNGLRVDSDIRL